MGCLGPRVSSLSPSLTCEHVREAGRPHGPQEGGEAAVLVGGEGLHQVADGQREHDAVHGVRDALRDGDVVELLQHLRAVDGHHLQQPDHPEMKRGSRVKILE